MKGLFGSWAMAAAALMAALCGGCGSGGVPPSDACLGNLRTLAAAARMYAADYDEVMAPGTIIDRASGGAQVNVASWKNLVYPYVRGDGPFECPTVRAALAQVLDATAAWSGYWSAMDTVWVSCSPSSPTYTGDPACAYAGGRFFRRSYVVNGGPFGAMATVGGSVGANELCGECATSVTPLSVVTEPAETCLMLDGRNVEPFAIPATVARCWQEMGMVGSRGQYHVADATSPTGFRNQLSWLNVHAKGANLVQADGHAVWTTMPALYDGNLLRYDCMRRASDTVTWPANAVDPVRCRGYDGLTCAARAKLLLPAEYL